MLESKNFLKQSCQDMSRLFPARRISWYLNYRLRNNFFGSFLNFLIFSTFFALIMKPPKFCYNRSCSNPKALLSKAVWICPNYVQLKGFADISATGLINNFSGVFYPKSHVFRKTAPPWLQSETFASNPGRRTQGILA